MNWQKWWKIQARRYYKRYRRLIAELEEVWEHVAELESPVVLDGPMGEPRLSECHWRAFRNFATACVKRHIWMHEKLLGRVLACYVEIDGTQWKVLIEPDGESDAKET